MTLLVDVVVKAWLLVAVTLAAMRLLRERSAALRHWVLALALAFAVAMPLLTLVAPAWRLPLSGRAVVLAPSREPLWPQAATAAAPRARAALTVESNAGRAARPSTDAFRLLTTVWATGAGVSVALLLIGLARLRYIAAGATPLTRGRWAELTADLAREAGIRRPVTVLRSDHPTLLVTWGFVRPRIVLPAAASDWSEERARIVLRHELAHVGRGDWLTQLIAELARTLHWFNPVMWIACRTLRRESELACDDAVLNGGIGAADYASHLVDLARALSAHRRLLVPAPGMARPSDLERRIAIMLHAHPNRNPLTWRNRIAAAAILLGLATCVAGLRAQRFSTFSGTLTDQTNAVLPGVAVTLSNAAAQTRYEVRTDRTGHFELPGLGDGEYQLAVFEPGFNSIRDTVTISGRDVARSLQMQIGDLHETISITAGAKAAPGDPAVRQAAREYAAERNRKVAEKCAAAGGPVGGNIGGNIMQPTKVADFKPRYPENLQAAKVGGVVTLEALIGTDGTVREVHLVNGDPDLGAAAADAIRQWEFSPTYLNCTPVEVHMGVTANFVAK